MAVIEDPLQRERFRCRFPAVPLGIDHMHFQNIGPGQVTTATTATATLDNTTAFPYHIAFNNAALNVSQCASPVAAVPFVSATVSTPTGLVQTTAYGDQFTF